MVCVKVFGKIARKKQVSEKKKHLSIKLSINFYSIPFHSSFAIYVYVSKHVAIIYANNKRRKTWTILIRKVCYRSDFISQ